MAETDTGIKVPNLTYKVVKFSDWAKLKRHLIPLEATADFGWDAHIINMMIEFKIMPNRYIWSNKVYLRRDDVVNVNNRFITNEVNRYKMFDDYRKRQDAILAEAEKTAAETESTTATEEPEHE